MQKTLPTTIGRDNIFFNKKKTPKLHQLLIRTPLLTYKKLKALSNPKKLVEQPISLIQKKIDSKNKHTNLIKKSSKGNSMVQNLVNFEILINYKIQLCVYGKFSTFNNPIQTQPTHGVKIGLKLKKKEKQLTQLKNNYSIYQ